MSKYQYFYILKNDSLSQDWVKVMTSYKALSNTSEELTKTELPTPFSIVAGLRAEDVSGVQHYFAQAQHITTTFKFGTTRDFINISATMAQKYLAEAALFLHDSEILDVDNLVLDDADEDEAAAIECTQAKASAKADKIAARASKEVAKAAKETAKVAKARNPNRLPPFRFNLINLKPGDDIVFAPLNLKVRIVDDQHVRYKGNEYSTSHFCKAFLPNEMRKSCNTYRGPDYFTFKGKTLTEIRKKLGV